MNSCLALALLILTNLTCQVPQSSPRLTSEQRSAALNAIKVKLQEKYVFREMRPKIVETLTRSEKAGRYDVDDPYVFATRLTEDMRAAAHDHHLCLSVDQTAYRAALEPSKGKEGTNDLERRRTIRNHHGLTETRILPGNVRYLKIASFDWLQDETGAVYDDAMRFLRDGDAIIIDIRGNGGGTHSAVQYLISHFLEPGTLEYTFVDEFGKNDQIHALDYLPAGRLIGKPLFVLINGGVGSAAEAFAYDIRQFKLGELVGSKTVGAANTCSDYPIAPEFMLTVSTGHPIHAISHSNWEGEGVSPTVPTSPAEALDVAESLALKRLNKATGISPEIKAEYAWALVVIEARLHPVTLNADKLKPFVGHYQDIEIREDSKGLSIYRPTEPGWPKTPSQLTPLNSEGLFAIEGISVLRVHLTGKRLELVWSDRTTPEVFPRTAP